MKDLNEMTREDFEALPIIEENEIDCDGLILLPTKKKHESGYAIFYACPTLNGRVLGKVEAYDVFDIKFYRELAKIDCLYKSKLIRIFFGNNYKLNTWLHWLEQRQIGE